MQVVPLSGVPALRVERQDGELVVVQGGDSGAFLLGTAPTFIRHLRAGQGRRFLGRELPDLADESGVPRPYVEIHPAQAPELRGLTALYLGGPGCESEVVLYPEEVERLARAVERECELAGQEDQTIQ